MKQLVTKYGDWALVTGASSGIGEQFCHILAESGMNLLISSRRSDLLKALERKLEKAHGIEVDCITADLSKPRDQQNVIRTAENYDIGLLISNAGFGHKGLFESQTEPALEAMLQVNLLAPTRLLYKLLPLLKQRVRSGIILTGSIEGETPFAYSAAYSASKAYLHSLANALYHECRSDQVDVMILAPGSTDTNSPISQGISREQLPGLMSPEDVARQALDALGSKPLFIPGIHNRLPIRLLRMLPRKLAIKLAGEGMKSAIDKSQT